MFGYNPYGAYSSPYGYGRVSPSYSSPDADYLRALAQERAAQEQLLAARRAQEEARQRAELAQSRYGLPSGYNPLYEDYEDHDSYDGGYIPYGFGGYAPLSRQRQASLQREQQRALQRELERREREQEREHELERLRLEEEKRQLEEEKKMLVEEERRQRLRAEELKRREQEYNRQRVRQLDPLFGPFGWMPDEEEDTIPSRTGPRPQTVTPSHRRGMASQGMPAQPYLKPSAGASRSSSVPPRSAAPPSPIRPSASGTRAETGHFKVPIRTPSPRSQAAQATPQQHDAARRIQDAYRAHAARSSALRTIEAHRNKFAHLKAGFRFPSSLDFQTAAKAHEHVSVPVAPAALAALVLADGVSVEEGRSRRPQLAYTSQNAPVHAYLEELNRLLSALDAVESGGDREVRERRKGIVREVEAEAERVEAVVGEVWSRWQAHQESGEQQQQTEETVKVAPGTFQVTLEHSTATQQEEKAMDIEPRPDQDAQPEAHLGQPPPSQPMQTEETVKVAPGVYEAAPQAPTAEQQDEKRMDVEHNPDEHTGNEAPLDIVPHVEPMEAEESTHLVPASHSSAGASSDTGRPRTEDGDEMQVESKIAPSPEVDIPDAEPEKEVGYESNNEEVAGRTGGLPVPGEVEAPPTPEIDIKDADEEDKPATQPQPQPTSESSESSSEPVHIHPQISAIVDEPPAPESLPATQPQSEVRHFERSPAVEGESSTAAADPATPTLSPSHGDAESEEEGPGTPPMGPSPHIVVTPAEEHPGVRVELGTKERSEQKGSAEEAHEMRMAGE